MAFLLAKPSLTLLNSLTDILANETCKASSNEYVTFSFADEGYVRLR